jgi:hypothetical protein
LLKNCSHIDKNDHQGLAQCISRHLKMPSQEALCLVGLTLMATYDGKNTVNNNQDLENIKNLLRLITANCPAGDGAKCLYFSSMLEHTRQNNLGILNDPSDPRHAIFLDLIRFLEQKTSQVCGSPDSY